MVKNFLKIYLVAILLLVGCNIREDNKQVNINQHHLPETSNKAKNHEETEEIDKTVASPHKGLSLEKQFLPPNFLVKQIDVEANSQSIRFDMSYTLSEQLYKILEEYKDYYFVIEYPDEFANVAHTKRSQPVKGPVPQNGQLSHSVTITSSWNNKLPADLIKKINSGELRYNLMILDREKFPVHIFNDVQWYQSFDPNKSSNIIFEQKSQDENQ